MADKNFKLRITKCYLVEVVDKDGNEQEYRRDGNVYEASDFCFGTKEDAKKLGEQMIKWVEGSENE